MLRVFPQKFQTRQVYLVGIPLLWISFLWSTKPFKKWTLICTHFWVALIWSAWYRLYIRCNYTTVIPPWTKNYQFSTDFIYIYMSTTDTLQQKHTPRHVDKSTNIFFTFFCWNVWLIRVCCLLHFHLCCVCVCLRNVAHIYITISH